MENVIFHSTVSEMTIKADNNLIACIVLKAMCILHFMFPGANTTENEPDTTYPVVSLL